VVSESKRNTESLRSFLVALNGRKIPSLGNIGYRLSFMRQAKGVGNAANENSVAAAVFTSFGLGGDVTFAPPFSKSCTGPVWATRRTPTGAFRCGMGLVMPHQRGHKLCIREK
jgi:hypothetical protein